MAKRIGKYKMSNREIALSAVDGATIEGSLDGITNLTATGTSALAVTTVSSTLGVTGVSTLSGFVNTAAAKGLQHGGASISGLAASLQTTGTIAVADDSVQVGKFCTVSADAQTLTLPAVVVGAKFIIVNIAADGGALLTISPNANDKFLVDIAGAAGTDNKDIINTKATQNQYDYVSLVGLTADGWLIDDIRGTWVDQG